MMPSRSAPNLQQPIRDKSQNYFFDRSYCHRDESPPPAPPVRDASTLKSIKYGPGHEKFPSWPVPAAADTPQIPKSGGSHRSKSWTDHTNYPKEKVVTYTRPYMKRQQFSYTQQQKLKTVMERCEKIPPETFESRYPPVESQPHTRRASPPERDRPLTRADLEAYARSYQEPRLHPCEHENCLPEPCCLPKHHRQLSYAQSEGYHSYVSSADSTCTPFLDRLRRDSEVLGSGNYEDTGMEPKGRDSVVTTSSGSASSSETLKWHGSMSDISVASGYTHLANGNTGTKQLIAHSARVQTPQRHHSESVLFMEKTDFWKDREIRNNKTNKKLFAVSTYTVKEAEVHSRSNPSLSVADRVIELEKQQKYSYLDPEKRHKVPDPTLKAIQKKALLSFYERHHSGWRTDPQPPPRTKAPLPSRRASSASDYSKRGSLASSKSKTTENLPTRQFANQIHHQHSNSCGSLSTDLLGPIIVGPSISIDDFVPDCPPARPPKNPQLRSAYPDLFQRLPSPDLPPPSPPPVLEDEMVENDDPLPPPPPDCDQWQAEKQVAAPQVHKIKQTVGLPVAPSSKSRPSLGPQRVVFSGSIAVSQKVTNGCDAFRAEPLGREPRLSVSESPTKEAPPPLQPRQARTNQSLRGRVGGRREMKEAALRENRSQSLSQSKASYLASRRDRIVPDSDTGSYKRTMSPSGHTISMPEPSPPKDPLWYLNRTNKDLHKNNSTNIMRRSSMKEQKIEEKEESSNVLPDVLPVNAKLRSPNKITEETKVSPPESPSRTSPFTSSLRPNLSNPPLLASYIKTNEPPASPKIKQPLSPSSPAKLIATSFSPKPPDISPPASPKQEKETPKVLERLQLIQRTEVVLRVNALTTDASSQTEKDELPPTPLPCRKKLQEEIDCEKLSEELVTHLPTSDRLKELLVPGPDLKKPTDYVQGLFKVEVTSRPRPSNSPFRSKNNTPSSSPPPVSTITPTISSTSSSTNSLIEPTSPLSGSSTYFTISEPKAKFLTRYSQDMSQCHVVQDTKDLSTKKEELVSRLDRKLEVLRSEQLVVTEECKINNELGDNVEAHIRRLARPHEVDKFRLHIEEVGKITSLLLGLSGRLARAENALMGLDDNHPEKRILENKRDKLLGQLEEAKKLKESIDRRSVNVSNILCQYLNSEEYTDYDHFINMKAKLIMDSKEIADKIKLGEEQLLALKETDFF